MYYAGIDLGGTNIAAGIVDEQNRIIGRASRKTQVPCSPEELTERLALTILAAAQDANISLQEVPWIGVGCPGTVDPHAGMVEYSCNLFVQNFPLEKLLGNRLQKEIRIENDANAAAYGEYKAGALQGSRNALAVTLGTGVGSGILIDGKIYAGSNFCGGEMGHMVIEHNGRACTCGRKGCWETYSSATGLIATTKLHLLTKDPCRDSIIWEIVENDLNRISGRTAFDAMRRGDALAAGIIEEYISYLACGIANCINILQPDILCIGGGISNEGDTLLIPLREQVSRSTYNHANSSRHTHICQAQLGNDAGIIGAALLEN